MQNKNAPLTDSILLTKAKLLTTQLEAEGHTFPAKFKCSNDWLLKWKKAFDVSCAALHGEAASSDMDGVNAAREGIPELVKENDIGVSDLFNTDETGLFYRKLPTRYGT